MQRLQLFRPGIAVLTALWLLPSACDQAGNGTARKTTANVGSTPAPDGETPGGGSLPDETKATTVAEDLTIGTPSTSELFTKEAGENGCATIQVTALSKSEPLANAKVSVSVQASAAMDDVGTVKPSDGISGADGKIEFAYCSGAAEGRVALVFKSGTFMKNSAIITVTRKPIYRFVYVRSDADPLLAGADAAAKPESLFLNLFDSGPQDCTTVYFKLTKSDKPVSAVTVRFRTQVDPPKRMKLEKRDGTGLSAVDTLSQKKYAYFDAKSTGAGEFAVPVCAGVSLGSILISGTYTDEESRSYTVNSPVIRITAGLTNYINMSLTFDPANARTLRAYYNTNSDYLVKFNVELGARQDGEAISDYPVLVASEVGRIDIANEGKINADKGNVAVQLHALHLSDNYPFLVYPQTTVNGKLVSDQVFRAGTTTYYEAQTRCDPKDLADWAAAKGGAFATDGIKYADLRQNWRSTLVYAIRGQEHYNDENKNGVYDGGGYGFWDKNQNGIFDGTDTITYDPTGTNNAANFNYKGEWFIDMPSPFIDVNENNEFDDKVDIVIGDAYQAPNGKRDADTTVWKYEYFPVSMGPSPYSIMRQKIFANTTADLYNVYEPNVDLRASRLMGASGVTYPVFGAHLIAAYNAAGHAKAGGPLDAEDFWVGGTNTHTFGGIYQFAIFAHDICGNVLPGGSSLELSFRETKTAEYGTRAPMGRFFIQDPDIYYEPARRLLKEASGGSTTILNFNASDHISKENSYPIIGSLAIPACSNACTGAVTASGVACDSWEGYANLSVKEPDLDQTKQMEHLTISRYMTIPAVKTCTCATGAYFSKGVCLCMDGQTFDAIQGKCVDIPVPVP